MKWLCWKSLHLDFSSVCPANNYLFCKLNVPVWRRGTLQSLSRKSDQAPLFHKRNIVMHQWKTALFYCLFNFLILFFWLRITCNTYMFTGTESSYHRAPMPYQYPIPQLGLFNFQQHAFASAMFQKQLQMQQSGVPQVPLFPFGSGGINPLNGWPSYYPTSGLPDIPAPPTSRPEPPRLPPPAHAPPPLNSSPNQTKDALLTSSIESLRFRARQHAASLGFYDNV